MTGCAALSTRVPAIFYYVSANGIEFENDEGGGDVTNIDGS